MEGEKQTFSSFTSDLFGSKESSSSGILDSIFAPPSKVSETEKKNGSVNEALSATKTAVSGGQGQSWSTTTSKDKSSYYQVQNVQPFHYSSSIYYGGQDVYSQPQIAQNSGVTTFSKDVEDDDSGSASRGNWWQGSLYY